ncbi:LOW QUALITY PROTEIN: hypothetical protein U9M48_007658 [Paspalum notatum var. saurae]|uniref:Myb/SANT-like domain-containing protein n=1 Tax=Paspalum notatum var. saurae TaxID=547442 RepID=A0AAQ3WBW8_PASNO
MAKTYTVTARKKLRRQYGPLVSRDLTRQTRLDELYNGTDRNCILQLRMRKAVFWKLSARLRDASLLQDTIHVSVEEQLAMFLHTVGHNLRNCVIGETVSRYFNEVLTALCSLGKYYLADAGYAVRPGILPPYRGVLYHLKEYGGGRYPETAQELFNLRHSSLLQLAFGTLKNRFKILANRPYFSYSTQVKLVIACCAVHNWILDNGPDEIIYDEELWYNTLPRSARIAKDQGIENRRWVAKRDDLANLMWRKNCVDVKGKGGEKARAKATSWPAVISEFLLDWYIEKKLAMPPKTCFKRLHHTACTTAINSKYGTTYTVDQVQRHWRRHKDTWGLVAKHMNESGGGWDENTKLVTVFEVTMAELSYFDKLQELFSGSTADGSFMQDPATAAEADQEATDVYEMINDMANYDKADDPHRQDSDKLESNSDDCQEVAALTATSSHVSSSSVKTMKAKKMNFKRVGKSNALPPTTQIGRASKSNTKTSPASASDDTDVELTNTLKSIQINLTKPVQVAPPSDPNALLWDMLKKIALTAEDRLTDGSHNFKFSAVSLSIWAKNTLSD